MSETAHSTARSPARTLARIGRLLAEASGLEDVLSLLLDAAVERLGAAGAAALLVTEDGRLRVVAARDLPGEVESWSTEADVVGRELGERLRTACGPGFAQPETLLLVADGNVYGALVVLAASGRGLEGELDVVQGLADLAAVAIGKSVQVAKLERAYVELQQLREMQKRAQQRERLADIGAIAAKIAHDLGNPLSGLSMQAQLIVRRARRDPTAPLSTVLKPAEHVATEAQRLEALIRELLSFTREQQLELQRFDPAQLVRDVFDLWQPVAAAQRVELTIEVPDPAMPLEADVGKLHRVLDNLIKNAIEAIGEGPGEVRLAVSAPRQERIWISVEDDGPGIAENVRLFHLFETTKEHGTGLGLAISKQIMLAHGGDLLVARREPRGTVFHAELPLRRA
jgi:signal transduction histidine kinase